MLRKSYVRCCEYEKEVGELKDFKKILSISQN